MPKSNISKLCLTLTFPVLLFAMRPAMAQYVWVDEGGVRQYSDQPPPVNTPRSKIIKMPKEVLTQANDASSSATTNNAESDSSEAKGSVDPTKPKTIAEKEADYRKKKSEQAEKDKKSAEEARRNSDKARNCARAREYQAALDSGQRISKVNTDGERAYLSDEERSREAQENRRTLNDCR